MSEIIDLILADSSVEETVAEYWREAIEDAIHVAGEADVEALRPSVCARLNHEERERLLTWALDEVLRHGMDDTETFGDAWPYAEHFEVAPYRHYFRSDGGDSAA